MTTPTGGRNSSNARTRPITTNVSAALSPHSAVADPARLAAVDSYRLTGHAGDPDLDSLVSHLAQVLRVPTAVINLVGPDHQCYPAECGAGIPSSQVPDKLSFCAQVVAERAPLMVSDARSHPVFSGNPLVLAGRVASYLGVPLIDEDGFVLGTLSVFDSRPREFTAEDRGVLEALVGLVRVVLSLRRRTALHAWDAQLLAAQGRVLEEVATGRPLVDTLDLLAATVRDLTPTADAPRLQALRTAVDRLTAVAIHADERRRAMERMAHQDSLTGLANRAYFTEAGSAALAAGGAVLFIDLDRFKEVNDRGGHALGDQLLIRIARRLREQIAEVTPDAVVGRLGGDEFAAVLPGLDREAAAGLGGRLVHALVDEVVAGRRTVRVSSSIGLAMARPGSTFDDVLRAADDAMYAAKDSGRGGLHLLDT
ncbi:MAG: Diguanylate cyclase with sensor [Modestobacter sp.]|nr:Diguanylate cyclase with sensor [Modestobacter sp.]